MTIREFVDYMKKNTNRTMKEDQVASLIKRTIEPKAYMSVKDKKELVNKIVNQTIYYDNGIFKFNSIDRYIYFTMYTIEAYTNLELSADIEEDFDVLSESKLLPAVICLIQQEFDDVNVFLQMQCDYILSDNSIEAQLGKFLDSILEKLDGVGSVLSKYLKNINIDELLKSKDEILQFLNKYRS